MTEYIQKHLARNVPLNFDECCERIRASLPISLTREPTFQESSPVDYEVKSDDVLIGKIENDSTALVQPELALGIDAILPEANGEERRKKGKAIANEKSRVRKSNRELKFNTFYRGMVEILVDGELLPELDQEIGREILEIQVRFEAIQRTIDFNVPAKPIFERISKLKKSADSVRKKLQGDQLEENIRLFNGLEPDDPIPRSIEDFRTANSIAERALAVNGILDDFLVQFEEIGEFFHYKMGLVTRGKTSVYAVFYVVVALADLFEKYNQFGLKSYVQQTDNLDGDFDTNQYKYSGKFLDFVMQFLREVDLAEVERHTLFGLHDTIRKHCMKRRKDPELFLLLHEKNVDGMKILEFMKRADAIK